MIRESARLVRVDGNNNVHVDVSPPLLHAAGVDPDVYGMLLRPADGWFRIKLGAAAARYLGDRDGLGQDARLWPPELPERTARTIAAALPHARERIHERRGAGKRVSGMVFSNDLARVRGDDPLTVAATYKASADSVYEYERRIREIKSADEPLDVKAAKLADAVLRFGDEVVAARARRRQDRQSERARIRESAHDYESAPPRSAGERVFSRSTATYREPDGISSLRRKLSDRARRFIESGEALASYLATQPQHDWSGPIIGFCKAFELETVNRVLRPLCRELAHDGVPATDLTDTDIGRIASFCAGNSEHPPELGAIGRFLQTAAHSRRRAETSNTIRAFRGLVGRWGGNWLIDDEGATEAIREVTTRFRNPAAHTGELQGDDYRACRDYVAGPTGILWKLIAATPDHR